MRTNIVIDDNLMNSALKVSGTKTKKDTIEKALHLLIKIYDQRKILNFKGKLKWEGNLELSRSNR